MTELIFGISLIIILYTYVGYPLVIWCISRLCAKPVLKGHFPKWPVVTVVVAAKNEELNISDRVLDLIHQEYPKNRLEVLVVSDGSTDRTAAIVCALGRECVKDLLALRVIEYQPSAGKPSAINRGVEQALGEFIVFADARQRFSKKAIKNLVANFSDPDVGCVSGELVFLNSENPDLRVEMGAYWKYEKCIRTMESVSGSVMGATGAIYAIRKNLYKKLPASTLLDDVLTPLNILAQGYRVIFDRSAQAYDIISASVDQEWNRKVRTLAGNWQLLSLVPSMFSPFRHSWLWRFFSHKIARLLVPYVLVSLFVSSLLAEGVVFKLAAIMQTVFYLVALSYLLLKPARQSSLVKLCYFFCVMNIAAFQGFVLWVRGKCGDVWQKP